MYLLYWLVATLFDLYRWILIARIFLSWIRHDPYHPVIRFIYKVTDPVLEPLSRAIPPIGMIDISPIVAFLALEAVRKLVLGMLASSGL
ncbi:MAG TPA: YggT family protein [Bacillota bacterium]|nr:YggT family protein [Bacillota bacterium]